MKNKMSDLRNHLFEALEQLKDKEQPMDVNRAKAVCEVAQVIINSAKAELQFIEALGLDRASDFFENTQIAQRNGNGLRALPPRKEGSNG